MPARHALIIAISFLFSACGGGGSDSASSPTSPPIVNERAGGIWSGTSTGAAFGGPQEVVGISTDDGRFRFLSLNTGGQFIGEVQVSGTVFTGSGTGYAANGTTWIDGSIYTPLTVSGSLDERQNLSGDWETGTGESGSFSYSYDTIYERDSSLDTLAGTWTEFDNFGNPIAVYQADSSGRYDGQDTAGCLYTGQISIIDSAFNIYEMDVSITNCGNANGNYTGLGFVGDDTGQNDLFIYSVDNGTRALIGVVLR